MSETQDQYWMQQALQCAEKAAHCGEVPVGAVLVLNDELITSAHNEPIALCDPSAHAEILALRSGAHLQKNYRLLGTTLYVTLEPCLMCVGAMVQARIKRVVYGASDLKGGAVTSVVRALDLPQLNHRVQHEGGVLAAACGQVLSDFFRARR